MSTGTSLKRGSPTYLSRSVNASFLASISRCQNCGERGPSVVRFMPELGRADLEDVEHLEHADALAVGRQLEDVVAVVVGRDRLDPLGLELAQVRQRHHAAERAHLGHDRLRDLALVERVTPLLLQDPEGVREVRVADDRVQRRRLVVLEVDGRGVRVAAQQVHAAAPVGVDALAQREALLGVADRGLEHLLELEVAEAVEQLRPAVDRARHRGGVHAGVRDLGQAAAREVRARPARRRPAGRVEAVELLVAAM